jgi:23S rRNA pseudouridine1911/1915/1917 synthase
MHSLTFTLEPDAKPERLDRALRRRYPAWGRQAVGQCVSAGRVAVNGHQVFLCSWQVGPGDQVVVHDPPEARSESVASWDETWLLHHDEHLIVLDKPAGLLTESPRWRLAPNLQDLASERFGPLHVFHRLDRDTSGVVLLTRGGAINRVLDQAFKANTVVKEYVAVVPWPNRLEKEGEIVTRLAQHPQRRDMMAVVEHGGRLAITQYRVLATRGDRQYLHLRAVTGRTHQLRVHLAHLRAPIVGDRLYAPPELAAERLMLHAWRLTLPADDEDPARTFEAPLPPGFS